jgi:hypothetical protein
LLEVTILGRIKQPDSTRSRAKNGGLPLEMPAPQRPICPSWLTGDACEVFEHLAEETAAAGVPVKPCDAELFAMTAQIAIDYRECADMKLRGRIGRALASLLDSIGATPAARARMGVRASAKKAPSVTGKLLDMDKNRL